MKFLKKCVQMNLFTKQNRLIDVENELMVIRGEHKGRRRRDKLGDWD